MCSLNVGRSDVEVTLIAFRAYEDWHQSVCKASPVSGCLVNNSWKFSFVLHRGDGVWAIYSSVEIKAVFTMAMKAVSVF